MGLRHILITTVLAMACASAAQAITPAQPVSARFDQPDLTGQQRPINFALRAETTLADGTRCVVGGMPLPSAGNAMTQRLATVLLVGKDGTILWNRTLSTPGDVQGSRATHCTAGPNGSLYLLVETELASPYGSPINRLTVARIDAAGGAVLGGNYVSVAMGPDDAAISTWASPSPDALRWDGDHLTLTLSYALAPRVRRSTALLDLRDIRQATVTFNANGMQSL